MKNKILTGILLSTFIFFSPSLLKQVEANTAFSVIRMISPTVRIILRDNTKVWQELKTRNGERIWVDDK